MLRNSLVLIFCVTAVFLIVEVQSEKCWMMTPTTYITTDVITYSYVSYKAGVARSHIKKKIITKIGQRTRRLSVPCNITRQPEPLDWIRDYVLSTTQQTPQCNSDVKCINGDCDMSGECVCHKGYAEQNGTCVPVCDNCLYGTCVAPNYCHCDLGYEIVNGKCTPKNNATDCFPGYTEVNNTCEPYCSSGCPHGFCAAPETCFCLDGFRDHKDSNGTNICTPICNIPCGQGSCVAPDVCNCFEGYKADYLKVFRGTQCLPVCKDCEGTCVAPNKCELENHFNETTIETTAGTTRTTTESTHSYSTASVSLVQERNNTVEQFVDNKSKNIHEELSRKSQNHQDGVSILISIIIGRNNCGKYNISLSDGQDKY